ncbi:SDR family oxidoreductase [Peribacillus cavernae]|uniref:SDR family oxidoreductase n=1 Tax=Peribacillus cavernae TaxID=1674310 RepID=A0A3S0VH87_9BACI|nr:SDR family oxidoreductase [Peribacillus cavernae]MDQ0220341.1 NAD(P)-dependent dehydrogenase (short-subunit alcohol dehydrogenase family) [Peribacillus cavernae]RUQ31989.1 SDR family oxidoreductase [Peribacillus cavernae]
MKTVLITGTSKGIGKAAATFFANKGWNVIATMRSPEKETILTNYENILVTKLDVENRESIENAIAQGIKRFGNIDVIVNNAGYGAFGIFEAAAEEQIHRQFEVNVFGMMRVIKEVLPHFRARRSGTIINITSQGGRITFPSYSLYHATKFAVNGFSEALTFELAPFNIRVKVVEPGATVTEFARGSMDFLQDKTLQEYNHYEELVREGYENMYKEPQSLSSPDIIAKVIYKAATDNTNQLRYPAGQDAEKFLLKEKKVLSDEEFVNKMAQRFSITL